MHRGLMREARKIYEKQSFVFVFVFAEWETEFWYFDESNGSYYIVHFLRKKLDHLTEKKKKEKEKSFFLTLLHYMRCIIVVNQ